jgi:hypothetical protein
VTTSEGKTKAVKGARHYLVRVAFWLWIPAVLVPGSYLMARHLLTLPAPSYADSGLADAIATMRAPGEQGKWFAMHVMYAGCGCSRRVLADLLLRSPHANVAERIVFVGEVDGDAEREARARGYGFDSIGREELAAKYHVEAAPLLVVADPGGRVKYVGGYTDRKQSPAIRDAELVSRLVGGAKVAPLPVFGCAVSSKLQAAVNPLGIK